ncbi:MAG: hypothetical protein K0U74_10890 [Alphaproteobacteria bacterium]|nr:hypothetical protein [Alphaproteobacteria bacterium]
MDYGRWAERLMAMDDAAWQRHANPWSGWTRVAILPLLALAIWSRAWIGWYALIPVALVALWTWINPRLFAPPKSTDNWMSKVVMGERVWLNRDKVPIPQRHVRMSHLLNAASVLGAILFAWGLYALEFWPTVFGMSLAILAKLWFGDRMVWLFEEMKDASPEYRSWLY